MRSERFYWLGVASVMLFLVSFALAYGRPPFWPAAVAAGVAAVWFFWKDSVA